MEKFGYKIIDSIVEKLLDLLKQYNKLQESDKLTVESVEELIKQTTMSIYGNFANALESLLDK